MEKEAKRLREQDKSVREQRKAAEARYVRREKDKGTVRKALLDVIKNGERDSARVEACVELLNAMMNEEL
jgi:hypothetical protein